MTDSPDLYAPWADYYDEIFGALNADLDFYLDEARAAGGPVLEIGCGTGRLLLPMLAEGLDVEGLDRSPQMLDRLRAKAELAGLAPRLHCTDMRGFSLPRRYALIVVPFRTFLHLDTQDEQLEFLRTCRAHLLPEGRLIANFFHPSLRRLVEQDGSRRYDASYTDAATGDTVHLWVSVRNDPVQQRLQVLFARERADAAGRLVETCYLPLRLRWVYRFEFELLLRVAGFARYEVFGGFEREPLARDDQEMVWIAYNA